MTIYVSNFALTTNALTVIEKQQVSINSMITSVSSANVATVSLFVDASLGKFSGESSMTGTVDVLSNVVIVTYNDFCKIILFLVRNLRHRKIVRLVHLP
jgi:hypothetical protein